MKKDRLYLFTFLAITVIFTLIATIAVQYFVRESTNQLFEAQLESARREAKEISLLVAGQLANGTIPDTVIAYTQHSLQSTHLNKAFVSMFDWSGTGICHPDIKRVGQKVGNDQSFVSSMDGVVTADDFYTFFVQKQDAGEINDFENEVETSEIVYLFPVSDSDWIVGAHLNLSQIEKQVASLRNRFYIIFVIMGFVIILSSVITVRLLGSKYENKLETAKTQLEGEVVNLAKLNSALSEYQQKVIETKPRVEEKTDAEEVEETVKEKGKKRILTYLRDELLSVSTEEIAYIYTENTITYVVDVNGKRSTTNSSLDELFSGLDEHYFYRANRQVIIAISSIEKIIRYGNNQLKILITPKSEVDIIIGKNKAAEFKQWLNI